MNALLIVGGGAFIVGGWIAWQVQGLRHDSALLAAQEGARKQQEQVITDHNTKQGEWESFKATLITERDTAQAAFDELKRNPVTTIVYREKVMPNGTTCPDPRVAPDWRVQYDATAEAADRAIAGAPD